MRIIETPYTEEFDCPVLEDVAVLKFVRRSFRVDEIQGDQILHPEFAGCKNVYDCGVVAKRTPSGYSFDWSKCPAWQSMNSKGKV